MRPFILLIIPAALLLLTSCAREAIYADHEFGMATNDAFDQQIVHKDYAHAGKPVNGLAGIHAEPIMTTYQQTFTEGFTKEVFNISTVGTEGDNSNSR